MLHFPWQQYANVLDEKNLCENLLKAEQNQIWSVFFSFMGSTTLSSPIYNFLQKKSCDNLRSRRLINDNDGHVLIVAPIIVCSAQQRRLGVCWFQPWVLYVDSASRRFWKRSVSQSASCIIVQLHRCRFDRSAVIMTVRPCIHIHPRLW